jgi:hypothetical protein
MGKIRVYVCLVGLLGACGDDGTSIEDFQYGRGTPGENLEEGGEMRLDKVYTPDGPIMIIQGMSFEASNTDPFVPDGQCTRTSGRNFWPDASYSDAVYSDLGATVTFSNGGDDIVLDRFEDKTDFLGRPHDIMYGGVDVTAAGVDQALVQPGETWTVDFDGVDGLEPNNELIFPEFPDIQEPAAMASPNTSPFTVTAGEDFAVRWTADPYDSSEHTADRPFDFILFKDSTMEPTILCSLPDTGTFDIPAEFIDDLDDSGVAIMGRFTHMLGAIDGHRLDLISIHCALAPYTKE